MTTEFDSWVEDSVTPFLMSELGEESAIFLIRTSLTPVPIGLPDSIPLRAVVGEVEVSTLNSESDNFEVELSVERRTIRIEPYAGITVYTQVLIGADVVPWSVESINDKSEKLMNLTLMRRTEQRERYLEMER